MKVVFMGTPDFAAESLKAVFEEKHEIALVVTNPDRPKGRGMKIVTTPVKEYAIQNGLKVEQPEKIKNNSEFIEKIKSIEPDVICVVAYGKILPKEILDIPKLGCINVHGSLLPKYRGAAPIQWAIINGESTTGITTMYMAEGMDSGDIILKKEVNIDEDETTGELWNRLSKIGGKLLVETLQKLQNRTAPRIPQGDNFTLAPMLDKSIAKINWEDQTAKQIKNLVRGLNPIMGAYTMLNCKKIKFWRVDVAKPTEIFADNLENIKNGTVLVSNQQDGLFIKAKDGILKVLEIQGENAKRMPIQDFLRGNTIQEFTIFK